MANSRNKGARGELELAAFLSARGFVARRGQQFQGSPDSPDVVCAALADWQIECKRTEALSLYGALDQAAHDAGAHKRPLVCHKRNRRPWVAILLLDDLLRLLAS